MGHKDHQYHPILNNSHHYHHKAFCISSTHPSKLTCHQFPDYVEHRDTKGHCQRLVFACAFLEVLHQERCFVLNVLLNFSLPHAQVSQVTEDETAVNLPLGTIAEDET